MNKSYPSQNMKRESLQGKKYLQLNKELVANIYKEFLQIKGQETDNPIGKKKKVVIHKSGKTKRINNVGKDVQDFLVKAGVLDSKYVQNLTTTLYCYHAHGSHHHLSPEVWFFGFCFFF